MSIIYVPRLIETAEQAEALPIGTIAQTYSVAHDIEVCVKDWDSAWLGTHGTGAFTDLGMVGFTALVPIEAEEETVAFGDDHAIPTHNGVMPNGDPIPNDWRHRARLVTPWESA